MRHSPVNGIGMGMDSDYDYRLPKGGGTTTTTTTTTSPCSAATTTTTAPPRHRSSPSSTTSNGHHYGHVAGFGNASNSKSPHSDTTTASLDGEEALLDLAQLEELHQEAERMKALGNKHMASQEYTRAYNAYSAALQLSPVGPSSHVFLSNRAAALLSLKRYSAAATDARRAVALAPTFGKAHARLGQALYFLKDYAGAVAAYEDAIQYEPDNQVTQTYLEKAKNKLAKQQEKAQRYARGEDNNSVADASSAQSTVINSIATDPHASAAIVSGQFRGNNNNRAMANAIAGKHQKLRYGGGKPISLNMNMMANMSAMVDEEEEDPDFDEALNIQKRANRFLANKQYKQAIEEYTAALFLVPDDQNLSPQLHLGRAHALNGSRRHASARNDAQLAIKIKPSAEAFSTLAKSLFYLKEYEAAVEAFESTLKLLPNGETLSQFDQAYLQKAEAAIVEEGSSQFSSSSSPQRKSPNKSTPVPKLPPPRFVPREQAINSTPNLPPMPKQWPQQSPRSPSALRCGPEREVIFFSESLGIKLNRGPDGIVRVLSVSKETPASPVARKGDIDVGDVIREAAGVDIRRPITNIMWGDTVALIRLSPRPIALIVAKELGEVPQLVLEQRRLAEEEERAAAAAAQARLGEMKLQEEEGRNLRPSPASGEEAVADSLAAAAADLSQVDTPIEEELNVVGGPVVGAPVEAVEVMRKSVEDVNIVGDREDVKKNNFDENAPIEVEMKESTEAPEHVEDGESCALAAGVIADSEPSRVEKTSVSESQNPPEKSVNESATRNLSLRDEEMHLVGAEILFPRASSQLAFSGWDNLRWMSYAGIRKIQHCVHVERLSVGEKKGLNLFGFGAVAVTDEYSPRKLVIYEEPNLILLLRAPKGTEELRELLDLPEGAEMNEKEHSVHSFLVVDAAVEPMSCKLRLSPLTTPTSVTEEDMDISDPRRQSCFSLLTPSETIVLTAMVGTKRGISYTDSVAFLETTTAELSIGKALCQAHQRDDETGQDSSWKHQIILGTLHSFVVLGSQKTLEKAIMSAMKRSQENVTHHGAKAYLHARLVDRVDDSGLTPLHYACFRRFSVGVALLVSAGARVDIRTELLDMAPIHLCAQNLDHKSLSIILSANFPVKPNPNLLDSLGRTPMYVAAIDGRGPERQRDPASLGRCIMALVAWGGQMLLHPTNSTLRCPHSVLAAQWHPEELAEVLRHSSFRYPLPGELLDHHKGISIGAFYHYPLHCSLISLVREIQALYNNEGDLSLGPFGGELDNVVARTIITLLCHGFEPNERLDRLDGFCSFADEFDEFIGFAPLQILACAALEADNLKSRVSEGLLARIMKVLADIVDSLVRNGARLSLDPPPTKRLIGMKNESTSSSHAGAQSDGPVIDAYDRSSLKIESNKQLLALLGASDRLIASKKAWNDAKCAAASSTFSVPFEHEAAYEEKSVPGGSSEKSCAICWSEFGSILNRRHKCRITQRYVCDDCSSKRISFDGKDIRLSDGQFLLARADFAKAEREGIQKKREQDEAQMEQMKQAHVTARQKRLDEEARRESLFGGVIKNAAGLMFGEEESASKPASAGEQAAGLSESLGQTRNALLDRGQKLDSLGEKTAQMVDASADFAKMAKELSKQSERGFFW